MKYLLTLIVVLLCGFPCFAQKNAWPSREELSDLLQKANQRVTDFDIALQDGKPFLSEARFKIDVDALTAVHRSVGDLDKNGLSAHALAGLTIKLDDLAVCGSISVQDILRDGWRGTVAGKSPNLSSLGSAIKLNGADKAVNDVAELIGHAALRMINVEENALAKISK